MSRQSVSGAGLLVPRERTRDVKLSVKVESCRGCIQNQRCQALHHGTTVVACEKVVYKTNALLEDIGGAIGVLEELAAAPHPGPDPHPLVKFGSKLSTALVVAMQSLTEEIESDSRVLVPNPVAYLLRCLRIVASFSDSLAAGPLMIYGAPLLFCLQRFSPLSRLSSVVSRMDGGREEESFSDAERKEVLCFVIASLLVAMRVTCIQELLSSRKSYSMTQGDDLVLSDIMDYALKEELTSLKGQLLLAFGLPADAEDDHSFLGCFSRFGFVRRTIIGAYLSAGSEAHFTLDATSRFPLPKQIIQLWAGVGADRSTSDCEDSAVNAILFTLLFVNDGMEWSDDLCDKLVDRVEEETTMLTSISALSVRSTGVGLVPMAFLLHRMCLVTELVDYRSQLRVERRRSGQGFRNDNRLSFVQWVVKGIHDPYSNNLLPLATHLSVSQHRCLAMARSTFFLLSRKDSILSDVCRGALVQFLASSLFGVISVFPLVLELLSASQLSVAEWCGATGDKSARASRGMSNLLSRRIADSLGQASVCHPQLCSSSHPGGHDHYRYNLSVFYSGIPQGASGKDALLHSGSLFAEELAEFRSLSDPDRDYTNNHVIHDLPPGLQLPPFFFSALACAPQRIAASLLRRTHSEDIASIYLSPRGVTGANITQTVPEGTWVLGSPFPSPSAIVPSQLFGWAMSASVTPLLAAEEFESANETVSGISASMRVFRSYINLQAAIGSMNKWLSVRCVRGLGLLENALESNTSIPASLFEHINYSTSDEELLAPISILCGSEPFASVVKNLLLHCCSPISPFQLRATLSPSRYYFKEEAGDSFLAFIDTLCSSHCASFQKNASALTRLKIGAARLRQSAASEESLGPSREVLEAVAKVSLQQLAILPPTAVAKIACACVVAPHTSKAVQTKLDRLYGPHLVQMQKYLASLRTPAIMRSVAAIFARERSYVLPDTKLLSLIREHLVLPWQPDLAYMYRPSFHQAMLTAACALVHRKGLPLEVVICDIIRAYIPSEVQEASLYEKGASVVRKCSIA